jgi:cell division protein FtsA
MDESQRCATRIGKFGNRIERGLSMAKKGDENLVVGLDIGTSKVLAIVGEVTATGEVEVIGVGHHPSRGMKKGVVVNIESTVQSIQRAIEEAELMAGCQIRSVYAGIAGSHIRSINSHGTVAIKDKEVGPNDVDRVIESARALAIPADQKVLHVLPQEFIIDGQEGIREPIGMSGVRLEAKVHIVTGAVSAAQNIVKCVRRCGLEVDDIILEQLASSLSVLSEDEKELGVCMVDIGGGTTDISVFTEGAIRHTSVIPIAGDQVTNDIAVALRTPTANAEEIKKKYGCALTQLATSEESIEVPSVGDRPPRKLARQTLAEVIEPRIEELYGLVLAELRRSGFEDVIGSGIVLTGGSAKMEGMIDLAEEVFHMPVRLGIPQGVGGLSGVVHNPIYATGVGLVLFGAKARSGSQYGLVPQSASIGIKGVLGKMKGWFQGNF